MSTKSNVYKTNSIFKGDSGAKHYLTHAKKVVPSRSYIEQQSLVVQNVDLKTEVPESPTRKFAKQCNILKPMLDKVEPSQSVTLLSSTFRAKSNQHKTALLHSNAKSPLMHVPCLGTKAEFHIRKEKIESDIPRPLKTFVVNPFSHATQDRKKVITLPIPFESFVAPCDHQKKLHEPMIAEMHETNDEPETIVRVTSSSTSIRNTLLPGQVSANFVRRNLKNKQGSCRMKGSKSVSTRGTGCRDHDTGDSDAIDISASSVLRKLTAVMNIANDEDNNDLGGSSDDQLLHQAMQDGLDALDGGVSASTVDCRSSASSSSSHRKEVVIGLASLGIDALQLSLDGMQASRRDAASSASSASSAKPTTAVAAGSHSKLNANKTTAVSHGAVKHKSSGARRKSKGNVFGFDDDILCRYAPKCPGHQLEGKLLTVKKAGPNKGKRFYGCSFPADQRCKLFMWAEDNPELVALAIANGQIQEKDSEDNCNSKNHSTVLYMDKLELLSVTELKEEIQLCRRRRQYEKGGKQLAPMKLSGPRDVLMKRLVDEADRLLLEPKNSSSMNMPAAGLVKSVPGIRGEIPSPSSNKTILSSTKIENVVMLSDSDDDDNESKQLSDLELKGFDNNDNENDDEDDDEEDQGDDDNDGIEDESEEDKVQAYSRKRIKADATAANDIHSVNDLEEEAIDEYSQRYYHAETVLRTVFGHDGFRPGQFWAVDRALTNRSSLLVMPTGAGKSICYMLPAAMLPGLTVVVSPLISLMQDQLKKLPMELPGVILSGGLSAFQTAQLTSRLLKGILKVLYVSPERLCTHSFRNLMKAVQFEAERRHTDSGASGPCGPAVSLLCVDEAHCLSQWSYNFRPAFLRIRREIKHIGPGSVLAMTATAPPHIQLDVMKHLGIPAGEGLSAAPSTRHNLTLLAQTLSEVREDAVIQAVVAILNQSVATGVKKASKKRSSETSANKMPLTIIYVWRRDEADSLSDHLKSLNIAAVAYHAGMDKDQRQRAQTMFDRGTARVIVATVAFGMGIDMAQIRQIVHCALPRSVENYLQETGRAGRDGEPATCHLLLQQDDFVNQFSLSHSTRLSLLQVLGLLELVFVVDNSHDDNNNNNNNNNNKNINNENVVRNSIGDSMVEMASSTDQMGFISLRRRVAVLMKEAEEKYDLSSIALETILSVLELAPFEHIQVDQTACDTARGRFHPPSLTPDQLVLFDKNSSSFTMESRMCSSCRNSQQQEIVLAIVKLNRFQKPERVSRSNASLFEQDEEKLGTESRHYNDNLEFNVSVLALSQESGIDTDMITKCLYGMQKQGMLEYSLEDMAMTCSVISNQLVFEHRTAYYLWKYRVAELLTDFINGIDKAASARIFDMWRTAKVIECSEPDPLITPIVDSPVIDNSLVKRSVNDQESKREFLSYYMSSMSGSPEPWAESHIPCDSSSSCRSSSQSSLESPCVAMFNSISCPVLALSVPLTPEIIDTVFADNPAARKLAQQLRSDAIMLIRDRELCSLVDTMILCTPSLSQCVSSPAGAPLSSPASQLQLIRRGHLAMLIAKILHGLVTPALSQGQWRQASCWARHRIFTYDSIAKFVCGFCLENFQ